MPKSNTEFWADKRRRNQERDEKTLQQLGVLGWKTLVVWECEVNGGQKLIEEVKAFLDA